MLLPFVVVAAAVSQGSKVPFGFLLKPSTDTRMGAA